MTKHSWTYFCLVAFMLQIGCGGGSGSSDNNPVVTPTVSPSAVALSLGQSTQFQATLPGGSQGVTWSVNGTTGGNAMVGMVDATGKYTAPTNTQSIAVTVTAASSSGSSASAQAYVVAPGEVEATLNPQVALYTITPPVAANVTIQFGPTTSYGKSTWTQGSPTGGGPVSTYVAGMLANTPYHMQATVQFPGGVTYSDMDHTFTTGALSASLLPNVVVTTTPGMTPQSGVELLDMVNIGGASAADTVVVTDLNGNVFWAQPTVPGTGPNPVKLLPNGHFLISYSGQPDGNNFVMQEMDLGGNIVWQTNTAELNQALATATCAGCNISVIGAHHDFAVLPNGHLILIASTTEVVSGTTVTGDVLIDLDQNRKPVWLWNEFDHLDINRRPYMYPDWTHTNAILYSPGDGDLIISIRHQNWLIKIDYNNGAGTGDILWHLGYQGDFTLLNADGSADNDPTDWFYAQHGPSFTTTNTNGKFPLVLFDNGDDRGVSVVVGGTCGVTGQPACYSTVPILNLDEMAMTATFAFHPTTPDYSFFGGNAEVLKNGNVEYDECGATTPANTGWIYEVTQASPPQTVWKMQVVGQYPYRGMRIPSLYPGVQW